MLQEDIRNVPTNDHQRASVSELKKVLDSCGSDKANHHNYHFLYGTLLSERSDVRRVLEIGLGTNNTDVVSNMGASGKPGTSLQAFRDFCPQAMINGTDIDERILFEEQRIKTFFVDQTDPSTFERLKADVSGDFDLVIDDGLHSQNANIESLRFGLQIVRPGGWVVIEDIAKEATDIWKLVAALLPLSRFNCRLYEAAGAMVFAVNRLH